MTNSEFIKILADKYFNYRSSDARITLCGRVLLYRNTKSSKTYELMVNNVINEKLVNNLMQLETPLKTLKYELEREFLLKKSIDYING